MKRMLIMSLILVFGLLVPRVFAESEGDSYQSNMERDFVRGFKNVLGSPLEIPITIQKYHEGAGRPFVRHMAGFFDGMFRMIARAGSGVWDFLAAFLPGNQEGLPPDPETLF
jgi:putative exosortase-associated protein (TIGR04073 family)